MVVSYLELILLNKVYNESAWSIVYTILEYNDIMDEWKMIEKSTVSYIVIVSVDMILFVRKERGDF